MMDTIRAKEYLNNFFDNVGTLPNGVLGCKSYALPYQDDEQFYDKASKLKQELPTDSKLVKVELVPKFDDGFVGEELIAIFYNYHWTGRSSRWA